MKRGVLVVMLAACGGTHTPESSYRASTGGGEGGSGVRIAGGRYARADVEHAIKAERDVLAQLEQRIADADAKEDGKDPDAPVRVAAMRADRVAGAAFVAQLTACLDTSDACPPSLDDPPIAADFDLATHAFKTALASPTTGAWPVIAAQLEKNACGCRTAICVDWVMADSDCWEDAVPADAQADETAASHVVATRACLWSRLGKRAIGAPVDDSHAPPASD